MGLRVPPFKVTQDHRKRHGSTGSIRLAASDTQYLTLSRNVSDINDFGVYLGKRQIPPRNTIFFSPLLYAPTEGVTLGI